jgi:hypothetical protein
MYPVREAARRRPEASLKSQLGGRLLIQLFLRLAADCLFRSCSEMQVRRMAARTSFSAMSSTSNKLEGMVLLRT